MYFWEPYFNCLLSPSPLQLFKHSAQFTAPDQLLIFSCWGHHNCSCHSDPSLAFSFPSLSPHCQGSFLTLPTRFFSLFLPFRHHTLWQTVTIAHLGLCNTPLISVRGCILFLLHDIFPINHPKTQLLAFTLLKPPWIPYYGLRNKL